MSDETQRCELCGRFVPRRLITLHHLTPRQKGGTHLSRVPMCKPCHKMVHATWANADLAKRFTAIEQLRLADELQPFLQWVRKQRPDRNFAVATSNDHPGSKRNRLRNRRRSR
jgi:5-methylcytosine-specific restriction protein A